MSRKFPTNSHRLDPYKNFKFRVSWDNRPVAGLAKMSALKWTAEAIEWREAGDSSAVRKLPGRYKYEPVTLEAGLTHDTHFKDWADQVANPQGDAAMSLKEYRKTVRIDVLNLQGVKVMSINLERAWVSEFQFLPEMDANANAVAIQTLKFEYEGYSLESSEPTET